MAILHEKQALELKKLSAGFTVTQEEVSAVVLRV
jgi:hypothetical protein